MSFSPDLCKFTGKKYVSQLNIKTQGFPLGGSQCGAGCFSLMLRISKIPPSIKCSFFYPPTAKMLILPFLHTPVSLLLSTTTCWEGIINNFKTNFTKNFTCISYLQEHNHSLSEKACNKMPHFNTKQCPAELCPKIVSLCPSLLPKMFLHFNFALSPLHLLCSCVHACCMSPRK